MRISDWSSDVCSSDLAALKRHALIPDGKGGQVWAYEIDGFGNWIFMDDANVPSLSGLALIDVVSRDDPLFRRTADLAWSDRNPYFFKGTAAEGIGGPHIRSEERRVGKGCVSQCRSRWAPDH